MSAAVPAVGDGATVCFWTDRHAATVTEVVLFKSGARQGQVRSITVQEDTVTRVDGGGMSDSQSYEFTPNPAGAKRTFHTDKSGRTPGLAVGGRSHYYDFSF